MEYYNYIASENLLPSRLDKILAHLSGFSRSKIQRLIKEGAVSVGGNIILDPDFQILTEITLTLRYSEKKVSENLTAKEIDFAVLYEDEDLLVINKPAGLTVHPGAGNYDDTLVNGLLYRYQDKLSNINGAERPGIVHRLDRDTTGLMVVAKNDFAHENLAKQIEERSVKRSYIAIVWGALKQANGVVDVNIGRSHSDRTKMKALEHGGKKAVTEFSCLKILRDQLFSLVECRLQTGRTHQIRVHMSHIGHSVVGDQVYGSNDKKIKQVIDPEIRACLENFKRQALHAYKLSFHHPRTKKTMEFEADLPYDMQNLLGFLSEERL